MRILPVTLLFLTTACDPGAGFRLIDGSDGRIAWPVSGDSVRGRVRASAFTISLTVEGVLDAPSGVTVTLDSAAVRVHDMAGIPLHMAHLSRVCHDTLPVAPLHARSCVSGYADLGSTNYDRLDSISVQFGYAISNGRRTPLVARFVRDR